jgi:hypothetical protein
MAYAVDAGFKVTDLAVPFVAEVETAQPILMNGNRIFDKNFVGGNGTSMRIVLPGFGASPTVGAAVDQAALGYTSNELTVTLIQRNVAVGLTQVQESLRLSSFEDQIASPYGSKLGSDIQKIAALELLMKADACTVIPYAAPSAGVSGSGNFFDISKSIANVRGARAVGELYGAVSNDLASSIMNSGISFFNPNTAVSKMFLQGELGQFRGTQFYETPDIDSVTAATRTGAAANLRVKTEITVDGTTTLVLEQNTGTLAGILAKGEVIEVTGSKTVDIYGVAKPANYSFVVQADTAAFLSNADITVTIKPLFFTGPIKNISGTSVPATAAATIKTLSGKTYARGIVWSKQAFVYASAKLKPLAMVKSSSADGEALSVMVQTGTDILGGADIIRWDTLTGFLLARSNWVSSILVELA